ncbi:hypothetical protein EUX98_g8606 [Antrodiella citrinella]|uniref:Uncharacterized protein n=1 Tax=Antrodiella citrinella TaxID=2447956 RepID=A0A4V3XG78_9APHY|nr:hypothetical protein EUX98_g8606 [Antrodiella citrinella]
MPRTSRHKLLAAARARSGLAASRQRTAAPNEPPNVIVVDSDSDSESDIIVLESNPFSQPVEIQSEDNNSPEPSHYATSSSAASVQPEWPTMSQGGSESDTENYCTAWTGGVSHNPYGSDGSDSDWEDDEMGSDNDSSDSEGVEMEVNALDGDELLASIRDELQKLSEPTPYEVLLNDPHNWKKAESQRNLGYNGQAERTKRGHAKRARDKEKEAEKMRKSASAALMRNFFAPRPQPERAQSPPNGPAVDESDEEDVPGDDPEPAPAAIFTGYSSDISKTSKHFPEI